MCESEMITTEGGEPTPLLESNQARVVIDFTVGPIGSRSSDGSFRRVVRFRELGEVNGVWCYPDV